MSQQTARISLPESMASQTVWYVSWFIVESVGRKPDWFSVKILLYDK